MSFGAPIASNTTPSAARRYLASLPSGLSRKEQAAQFAKDVATMFGHKVQDDLEVDPRDYVTHTARTLSQVLGPNSLKLSKVIVDVINDPFKEWLWVVAPPAWTDTLSIEMRIEEDLKAIAHLTPHYGDVRRVQMRERKESFQLLREGIGLEMELDRFVSPGGLEEFFRKVTQLGMAVVRRAYVMTMEALLAAPFRDEKRALLLPFYFSVGALEAIEKDRFCELCFGNGKLAFRNVIIDATSAISNSTDGYSADYMIIGPRARSLYQDPVESSSLTVTIQGGDDKQQFLEVKTQPYERAFPGGLTIFTDIGVTIGTEDGDRHHQALQNEATLCEFGMAGVENVASQILTCNKAARVFDTEKLNIGLTDMTRAGGRFVRVRFRELLERTYLWGDPKNPNHGMLGWMDRDLGVTPPPDSDPRRLHSVSEYDEHVRLRTKKTMVVYDEFSRRRYMEPVAPGESFLTFKNPLSGLVEHVQVLGQIGTQHWSNEQFEQYVRLALTAVYPGHEEAEKARKGLVAYVQLLRNIEAESPDEETFNEYVKELLRVNSQRSFSQNGEFVGNRTTGGIDEYVANEFGSFDLPVRRPPSVAQGTPQQQQAETYQILSEITTLQIKTMNTLNEISFLERDQQQRLREAMVLETTIDRSQRELADTQVRLQSLPDDAPEDERTALNTQANDLQRRLTGATNERQQILAGIESQRNDAIRPKEAQLDDLRRRTADLQQTLAGTNLGSPSSPSFGRRLTYPPMFNNPAGVLTIEAQGQRTGWDEAYKLAKVAGPFLRDLHAKCSASFTTSRALQADLAPSAYQNKGQTAAYTLAMVLAKQRPFAWLRVDSPADEDAPLLNQRDTMNAQVRTSDLLRTITDAGEISRLGEELSGITLLDNDATAGLIRDFGKDTVEGLKPVAGLITVNSLTGSGRVFTLVIPYVPPAILINEEVQNAFVSQHTLRLAVLGGDTVALWEKIVSRQEDEVLQTRINKLFDHLVQKAQNTNFVSARALVYKLSSFNGDLSKMKMFVDSLMLITTPPVVSSSSSSGKSKKAAAEQDRRRKTAVDMMKNVVDSYMKRTSKDQRQLESRLGRDSSHTTTQLFADKSSANPLWVHTYSEEAERMASSEQASRIRSAIHDMVYSLQRSNQTATDAVYSGRGVFTGTAALDTLDDHTSSIIQNLTQIYASESGLRFGAARLQLREEPDTVAEQLAQLRYARTPLTFHASLLPRVQVLRRDDHNVPRPPVALPSQPNSYDWRPLDPHSHPQRLSELAKLPEYESLTSNSSAQTNVSALDLPGVRVNELREHFREYGNIQNKALVERVHVSIQRVSDPLVRIYSLVYALCSIYHLDEAVKLAQNNVPLPIHAVPVYIRGVQGSESAIIGVSGGETANNLFACANFATGVDVNSKFLVGNFTVHSYAVVYRPNNIKVIHNVCPSYIEGGLDTTFYPFPTSYAEDNAAEHSAISHESGRNRPSLIVFAASPLEAANLPGEFDLIGRTLHERFANVNVNVEKELGVGYDPLTGESKSRFQGLSMRDFYDRLWSLRAIIENSHDEFGTFAYRTCYSTFSENECALAQFHPSTGPRRSGYGVGSAEVWDGRQPVFGQFDERRNTINC